MVEFAASERSSVGLIAYYLPQFHPIPENDRAWGEGFTEWTNVRRAQALFPGHHQPQVPAELGYYDLRDPEVLVRQSALARAHGLFGFCYYLYWFDGRRVLERPLETMLRSGGPDFPFCLCWANENWSRRWDGSDDQVLIEQPFRRHDRIIDDLIPYFEDGRYIRIDGAVVFLVYRPDIVPDLPQTLAAWRVAAGARGLRLFLVACLTFGFDDPISAGFDAAVEFPPHGTAAPDISRTVAWDGPFEGRACDYEEVVFSQLTMAERPYPTSGR
jgi:lipopolysaccharide biosynthesis protein